MQRIYLDYAATTPLDQTVLKKMLPYFSVSFANPASIHSPGQDALKAVEDARHEIAKLMGVKANELIFTSGATEANNLALQGALKSLRQKGDKRNHVITTKIEHASVIEPLASLQKSGYSVERLGVDKNGVVSLKVLEEAITDQTVLVSIGYLNSEIGSIQQIDKLGRLIRKINERRYTAWLNTQTRKRGEKPRPIYFHTDATQAINTLVCKPTFLNVDLLSFSGHKIYGPKGIGVLYCKKDTPLEALVYGGHQERNLRSGTLNVPAIIALAQALSLAEKNRKKNNAMILKVRNAFVKKTLTLIPQAKLSVPLKNISVFHAHLLFPGVNGDALVVALDELGLSASTGSACASGDIESSPVINALGYNETLARSAVRFSFGKLTTQAEALEAAKRLAKAYSLCLKRG